MKARELRFAVSPRAGEVSALLMRPRGARALLTLAHGAGADMRHAFMEAMAGRLADRGIATLRYQFPYTEQGRRGPNPAAVLVASVRAAVESAGREARGLPLLAGGKSMGGRMTSLAAAELPLPDVRGIVFLGFPLHAAGKPSSDRAAHLADVGVPMLFLQGSRDRLADLAHLEPIVRDLGARAEMHVVEDGDHSFQVPKRTGRDAAEIHVELAGVVAAWAASLP